LKFWISLLLSLFLLSPAWGETTSDWSTVRSKLTGDTGYSLRCNYVGPEGSYLFNYVVHGDGQKIFTEVLEGSTRGVGTKLYYDPEKDRENVMMQTRLFRLRRSLEARDIKDSPVHRPLFVHILDELCESEPSEVSHTEGDGAVFMFGDRAAEHEFIEVDEDGNPVSVRRMEADKEVNRLTFQDLEWGTLPMNWEE